MSKPKAPATPDYAGAAKATAQGNVDAARVAATANRVDQYGPDGSITYKQGIGGNPDHWAQYTTLSPQNQALSDKNYNIGNQLLDTATQGIGYVQNTLNKPFDTSQLPQAPINAGMTAQNAIMSRLAPELDREQRGLDTQLANQGLMPGSEAYQTAKTLAGQRQNDLLNQAALSGIGLDTQARQNALQEQEFLRYEPLNLVNALRSGNQVNMPQFQGYNQQATTGGPDLLGATNMAYQGDLGAYNTKQGAYNNLVGGLFGLGSAAIGGKR